jgi:hypothetical protein
MSLPPALLATFPRTYQFFPQTLTPPPWTLGQLPKLDVTGSIPVARSIALEG